MKCKIPPPGWFCTRDPDHDGPCAAWPYSFSEPLTRAWNDAITAAVEQVWDSAQDWDVDDDRWVTVRFFARRLEALKIE